MQLYYIKYMFEQGGHRMKSKRRVCYKMIFTIIVFLAFCCCGFYNAFAAEQSVPKRGGMLTVVSATDLASTDPHLGGISSVTAEISTFTAVRKAQNRISSAIKVNAALAVIAIVLAVPLMKSFGIEGAAIAYLIANICVSIALIYNMNNPMEFFLEHFIRKQTG